jgi:hypothetical protein
MDDNNYFKKTKLSQIKECKKANITAKGPNLVHFKDKKITSSLKCHLTFAL